MNGRMRKWFIAWLLCLLWVWDAASVLAAPSAGEVIALRGSAWADAGGQRRALETKASVQAGETLSTGEDSRLQVRFADNTVLGLGPQATVRLDAFVFQEGAKGSLAMHFAKGMARVVSGKIVEQNPDGFKLSSPLAYIGIRGTTTIHEVGPAKETHAVEFLTPGHVVVLAGIDGKSLTFDASMSAVDLKPKTPTPQRTRPLTPEERDRVLFMTVADRFQEVASRGIGAGERGFVRINPQSEAECRNTQLAVAERQAENHHDQAAIAGHVGALIGGANLGDPDSTGTLASLVAAGQFTRETAQSIDRAEKAASARMTELEEAAQGGGGGY